MRFLTGIAIQETPKKFIGTMQKDIQGESEK